MKNTILFAEFSKPKKRGAWARKWAPRALKGAFLRADFISFCRRGARIFRACKIKQVNVQQNP